MESAFTERIKKILMPIVLCAALWFGIKYIIPPLFVWLLPFALAYGTACIVRPIAQFLSKKYGIRKKTAHIISYVFILSAAGLFFGYIVMRIISELVNFAREVPSHLEGLPDFYTISDNIRQAAISYIPTDFAGIIEEASLSVRESLYSALSEASGQILSGMANFAAKLPDLGLFAIVFILCSYFFSVDYDRISVIMIRQVPKPLRDKTIKAKDYAFSALLKYLRGMLTMSVIMYALLLIGFLILKIDYAYLTAFLVALVDFFPLLGTGIILIPWGIFAIISGRLFSGIGILAVWGSVMVIRQLIEPKVMGKALGLHPLVTLIAAYTGYKVYGIIGAVTFPIVTLIVNEVRQSNE